MKRNSKVTIPPLSGATVYARRVAIRSTSPENQNESHVHSEYEIYVNLSGDVDFEVENRIYKVRRGSVILARPYEYHRCIYRSDAIHDHYWLLIDAPDGSSLPSVLCDPSKAHVHHVVLNDAQLARFSAAAELLIAADATSMRLSLAFLEAMLVLDETDGEDAVSVGASLPQDVILALGYMDKNLAAPITAMQLAQISFVSINTLERHFGECLGLTPMAMLKKKRLIASARYLRDGATVLEAAERSGFLDYSGYIASFREFFGITPLRYKKRANLQD